MSEFALQYLGDATDGVDWITRNYPGVVRVKNTVFNRADGEEFPGLQSSLGTIQKTIIAAIQGRCTWSDVYLPKEEENVNELHAALAEDIRNRHIRFRIESDLPLIECIVLEFRNSRTEVLIGWGITGTGKSRVYRSSERLTFDYFDAYCSQLIEKAVRIDPRPARPARSPILQSPASTPRGASSDLT